MVSLCRMSVIAGSDHFLVSAFINLSLLLWLVCFSHRFCHREWYLILRAWIASSYVICGYILVSEDFAAFATNSSVSPLPNMPICERIHMSLVVFWVVTIMFWILWARLHFVCTLVIDLITLKESLSMSNLSWLLRSEIWRNFLPCICWRKRLDYGDCHF